MPLDDEEDARRLAAARRGGRCGAIGSIPRAPEPEPEPEPEPAARPRAWRAALARFNAARASNPAAPAGAPEPEPDLRAEAHHSPPMHTIPAFYEKKPASGPDSLQARLSRRAFQIFIERQSEALLSAETLRALLDWPAHRVNYDQFRAMGSELGPPCRDYFTAATFMRFERDRGGRISVAAFVGFVVRREELVRARLHLSCYASDLSGYLSALDLSHFVTDVVQSLPQLEPLDPGFLPFYTLTAVSRFFFFLDPMHRQRIRIRELACSPELAELEALRHTPNDAPFVPPCDGGNCKSSGPAPLQLLSHTRAGRVLSSVRDDLLPLLPAAGRGPQRPALQGRAAAVRPAADGLPDPRARVRADRRVHRPGL